MKIKAGYRTTEFWFTLVSFVFSGLYLTGLISDFSQKEDLIRDVSHGVESCILIGGQLFVLYKYIKGRTEVKKIVEVEKLKEERKNERKRTSSRTSGKTSSRTKKVVNQPKKRSTK